MCTACVIYACYACVRVRMSVLPRERRAKGQRDVSGSDIDRVRCRADEQWEL